MLPRIIVGVVIPVFNRSRLVLDALDSIAAQSYRPAKIIVVDDGSTDNTLAAVKTWKKRNPEYLCDIVSQANSGAAVARNLGVTLLPANVTHLAFLDSDDIWPPDFLSRCSAEIQKVPDAVVAVADRRFRNFDLNFTWDDSVVALVQFPLITLLEKGAGFSSCSIISRQAFEIAGGYNSKFLTGHDIGLFAALARIGQWICVPGVPVEFRVGFTASIPDQAPHLYLKYPEFHYTWAQANYEIYCDAVSNMELSPINRVVCLKLLSSRYSIALCSKQAPIGSMEFMKALFRYAQLKVQHIWYSCLAIFGF